MARRLNVAVGGFCVPVIPRSLLLPGRWCALTVRGSGLAYNGGMENLNQWRDRNGAVWYWTGQAWNCDSYPLRDVINRTLPGELGPFTAVDPQS